MQTFSDPIQHCSSVIGRSLLEWYCTYEDYCCLSAAYKLPLPRIWRNTNVQIRQELARTDYRDLTSTDHQSRLLDDLWPQFWAITPKLDDIQETIILLKTMQGAPRFDIATRVEMELRQVIMEFTDFMNSSHVVEVLRPASTVPVVSTDSTCPLPLFIPYICQFPTAGYLRIVLHATLA